LLTGRKTRTGTSSDVAATALNESDGKQAWKAKIGRGGKLGNVYRPSGPRATPTVDGDRLFILGQHGDHHGGVVLVEGYLYGSFDPGILTCVEFKTGKVMWQERPPGKGSVVYADGRLYCRNEGGQGTVYLVEADPKKYVERGRFNQPDRTKEQAWAHPVIANGKMYIRDQDVLLCYDVKAK
jgi:outer membrane protein assembly factor BamB